VLFKCGTKAPESGVYSSHHAAPCAFEDHITVLKDEHFPQCCRCGAAVLFARSLVSAHWRVNEHYVFSQKTCLEIPGQRPFLPSHLSEPNGDGLILPSVVRGSRL
jgi:hypothetical protein